MAAKRVDKNQRDIVAALRSAGASVQCLHEVGHGFPDLLVCWRGDLMLVECKSEHGTLTPAEAAFHAKWPGAVHIIRTIDDCLRLLGAT